MIDITRDCGGGPGLTPIHEDSKRNSPVIPEEDYSADESGISAHSDAEDKTGYTPSSSDESHNKKCWDGSSDSAMRDSDGSSSMCSDAEVTATVAQLHIPKNGNPPNVVSSDEMSGDDGQPLAKNSLPDSDDTGLFSISENTDGHGSDEASRERLPRFSLPTAENRSLKSLDIPPGHSRKWSSTSSSDDEAGVTVPNVHRYKSRGNHAYLQSSQNQGPKPSTSEDDHLYSEITIVSDADESDAEDTDMVPQMSATSADLLKRSPGRGQTKQEITISSGSLADIMRQSISMGTFTRKGKLMTQKKTCNPVFDSSSIKKERQAAAERRLSVTKRLSQSSDDDIPSPYDSSDDSRSSNDSSKPKCGQKIKALQDILIKQSLPFANPAFFMVSPKKEESVSQPSSPIEKKPVDHICEPKPKVVNSVPRTVPPGTVPPPPPPPPPPPSTLPKVQRPVAKSSNSSNIMRRVSEKAYCKGKDSDDYCLDSETKTRIKSIKSMLQRASSVTEKDGAARTLPR